ncbi:chitinase [Kibdelosporangium phytohabitans]|uniref:chitinase n=1 Tax=Kibdelosporangium phytohabitans TaxID=860235 RepID=A0A0N9HZA2_9PSEU|nr:glycoside hydrolase family 18 protein [Kibdelosporangium phytohabitans]ALG07513.1 chitinase [Kibdelosporangium phytohabitans]MBE1471567.1 chitinase [Kibdelosporangium phytohabitans]
MVSRARRLLAAVVTAIAALVVVPAGQAGAANIVNNPGFETGTLSGWTCTGATIVSTTVRSGTHALAGTPSGQDYSQCTQQVAVQPNTAYKLSAWVNGTYTYLGVNGNGLTDRNTWSPTTGWKQLSLDFTTAASTTSVSVYLHGWYGQPTYYADDVSLDGPGGTPTIPAAPTGFSASASSPTSASLSWNGPSNATSFRVYRNNQLIASPTASTYTDSGLTAETTYSYQVSSVNSVGESPKTTSVSVTTPGTGGGNPGGPLPKHVLTGYWQNFYNGARALRLADVPTTYDIIAVSFVDAVPGRNGGVSFTLDSGLSSQLGGYTDAQFRQDIKTVQARGQKVIISVGGEKGTVWVGDANASNNFATDVKGLISSYGFDGVDIDLENGINATHMGNALRSIHAGGGKVITMAPQTVDMQSTQGGYFQLALNIKDILTIVNMQYYNSGTMLGCDQQVYGQGSVNFLTALACIQLQGGLRPDQVGLGLPASPSGAGGGYQSPGNVNNALNCLARGTNCGSFKPSTTWPGIRGAMTWSINWDASNGYQFANTVAPHLDTLP